MATTNASAWRGHHVLQLRSSRRAGGVCSPTAASNGDPQSLFQKAGSDGFYWEVGVTVTKSTSTRANWTFEIYQNSDTV